jgi:hypothetical protein
MRLWLVSRSTTWARSDGTHAGFEKHMAHFFLKGVGENRKYHWLKWDKVCKTKDMGGLGIIDSRILNIAIMLKWL